MNDLKIFELYAKPNRIMNTQVNTQVNTAKEQAKILKEQAKIIKAQKVIKAMQERIIKEQAEISKAQTIIKAQEKIIQNNAEPLGFCRGCGCEGNHVGDGCECNECWGCQKVFTYDSANWEKYPDYCGDYCEECNKNEKRC